MLNILVFPCGSEIGLEIHRSLRYSTHITLWGCNSVDDHGIFMYENYISGLPFYDHPNFIPALKLIINEKNIDAIYPAMDSVITKLSEYEVELNCKIIGSPLETNKICSSKLKSYQLLKETILIPEIFDNIQNVNSYPVFMKPDIGYGSRGAKLIKNFSECMQQKKEYPDSLILEYLPGKEYTVDCFTDKDRNLLFTGARERRRVVNGISVNTRPIVENAEIFELIAKKINDKLVFQGAWFFQVKENNKGDLALLEIAARLGGSSSLFRNLGVNFALLSIFDAFGHNVEIFSNKYSIELDRSFSNKYKLELIFKNVYVDFDDCVLLSPKLNTVLLSFLFQCVNEDKKLILLTKHKKNIRETLDSLRLGQLFDEIIHLSKEDAKWQYIHKEGAIFIDDSFAERKEVYDKLDIPVFAPDAIESLIK